MDDGDSDWSRQVDRAEEPTYSDLLNLESLLSAQQPLTSAHDEMLFIIQHQTTELWMKLVIHELARARKDIQDNNLEPAFKVLSRVARIFDQLNSAWDVLRTMTPSEYTMFREALGTSSGLQSFQYRMIEFMLGNRNIELLKIHEKFPRQLEALNAELDQPSIYDSAVRVLYRSLDGDISKMPAPQLRQQHNLDPEIQTRWKLVYEDTTRHWQLYELAEKLIDLEDYFRRWRFNHVTTVERVIGYKRGTGGTSGVPLLMQRLNVVLFPELWRVRSEL
ncbi:MAG: tryptophan 2,3-dioxygenase family protein [Gammaproteobacteria bacterium]|nr:tryptophan 2,3-dioxygenase family protein [Gammaproteobacteria bacterium]